jgi:hypothetical protein
LATDTVLSFAALGVSVGVFLYGLHRHTRQDDTGMERRVTSIEVDLANLKSHFGLFLTNMLSGSYYLRKPVHVELDSMLDLVAARRKTYPDLLDPRILTEEEEQALLGQLRDRIEDPVEDHGYRVMAMSMAAWVQMRMSERNRPA